jgi:hypothetical protein
VLEPRSAHRHPPAPPEIPKRLRRARKTRFHKDRGTLTPPCYAATGLAPTRRIPQPTQGPASFNDEHFCRSEQRPPKRGRQNDARGRRFQARPARHGTTHLLAFQERFEVVETLFEALAIHALNDERIGELS